ncbi:MAG TPA: M13 family metallopeptidase [Candidatus Binatia bacterium]|nr:M13 family metallopeptidase [Candidatus Binatia bacterium]
MSLKALLLLIPFVATAVGQQSQTQATPPPAQMYVEPAMAYTPSLDVSAMDRSVDACVDFYTYSCGGWEKNNPIPPDQASWSVYGKLYEDNLKYLRSILEQASSAPERDPITQKIGDYYAACMDEAAVEKLGSRPMQPALAEIAALKSAHDVAPLAARLHLDGDRLLFASGSQQDPDNSDAMIVAVAQDGLGLPDRDYYTKEDPKSKEIRNRYLQHVQKMFELIGDSPATAKTEADTVMRIETAMAKASLTRVERRDPYKITHKMKVADLDRLAPNFDWPAYFAASQVPPFEILNVDAPDFFRELNGQLASVSLADWKSYLRFHVANSRAPYLSSAFVNENFEFYRKYLRGAKELQPRWKRCVEYVDDQLGEALGQAYVRKTFPPELKAATLKMTQEIEDAMALRIQQLDWMSPATKQQALNKLHSIRNKIGYPDKWRDYSSVKVTRDDFYGNAEHATEFENHRQFNKVGKPTDRSEWEMTPPTVNAYYNPQMNDINFPAGVLQPPLYDAKMDDAPNYGNTGSTIGHELTHGFDDEGRQFDARGNLKDWWTKQDAAQFVKHADCVVDQYAKYTVVDDIHINSKLTEGEDVADFGGTILAYIAWKDADKNMQLSSRDDLTPDQRFFVGFAQWACENDRPEDLRARAITDPHSPAKYRINGVVVNMPEFGAAFGCKPGSPMVKPADRVCKVW